MGKFWRLVKTTLRIIFKYRVTSLAAEVGFFTLLALPPLVLGLAAVAGLVTGQLGLSDRNELEAGLIGLVEPFLTADVVDSVIVPTFHQAVSANHYGLISVGFVLSLWSGSRAMNTYVDTITIMYGLGGERGFFRQRALAFAMYLLALGAGTIAVPLLVIGPQTLSGWLPDGFEWILGVYWPVVALSTALLLTVLYHVAVPVKTRWLFNLPGALLALAIWLGASVVMRLVLALSIGGTSIYGPLAAPIVVLIWLYLIAVAVLIGAALNAGIEKVWPRESAATATPSLVTRKLPRQPPAPTAPS
ncbi:YihY/virulence factor BrkB family protein [Spelaeicoccus albus]|uniref:Membrane protein n=1 Tax=Spelaeicoccus albus TaxID=1280376 RepID=A0A7Z0IIP6_9MICO|nr:YihY/virulence factor BrkB family protein [Spelaeicoccus albus]NYI68674.1 membrane protein [Spelaeicoccus albus]